MCANHLRIFLQNSLSYRTVQGQSLSKALSNATHPNLQNALPPMAIMVSQHSQFEMPDNTQMSLIYILSDIALYVKLASGNIKSYTQLCGFNQN